MTKQELADLINARMDELRDHIDRGFDAFQASMDERFLALTNGVRDAHSDTAELREIVEAQNRLLDERR